MTTPDGIVAGRLLVGGEQLSEPVDRARGGGEKFHPQTFEAAQALLQPQVSALAQAISSIPSPLRANRIVFEATLLPNYLANSYFPDTLLSLLDLTALGSRPTVGTLALPSGSEPALTKSLIVAGSESSVSRLSSILATGGSTKSERAAADELRQLGEIRLPRREDVLKLPAEWEEEAEGRIPLGGRLFEVVLHPDPDAQGLDARVPLSRATFSKFVRFVNSLDGRVLLEHRDDLGGLTFVPIELPEDQAERLAEFNPLRSVRSMPRIRPVPALPLRAAPRLAVPPPPPPPAQAPEVLVFDAGVNDRATYFRGAVELNDASPTAPIPGCIEHGSAVTAAVLYGYVDSAGLLPEPVVRVHHSRVVPGPDTDPAELYWILGKIEEVVVERKPRLVNLSLGPEAAIEDGEPHRWALVLDRLAYEHDVLFVAAAGNNGLSDAALGLNRVQVPSDMVNGMSVGGCDAPAPEAAWSRALHSPVGPGRPGARVQPVGVAYGGHEQRLFTRLGGEGELSGDFGTSYSAPIVTHGLGKLVVELGDICTAPTLRAMAAHFAEAHADDGLLHEVGYGRLRDDYESALECREDEVTVLYQGSIFREEVLGFQLPVPDSLTDGVVALRWTLAYSSPTDPTEALEYTKVGLEATLRPHAAIYSFRDSIDAKRTQKANVLTESARVASLIADGWKQSQNPVSRSTRGPRAGEEARRLSGKWETLWRTDDRMRASSLWRPRLDISQLAREGGALSRDDVSVDFSLVVTVQSLKGHPVYRDVRSQFGVLAELPRVVPVELRVEG